VNAIYGWAKSDTPFIINSIVSFLGQILVLVILKVYKPFGKREWIVIAAMFTTIVCALVLPFKNGVQMCAQALNLYGGADQPVQLKSGRDTGALAFWSLALSCLSGILWMFYCLEQFGFWGPAAGYVLYTAYSAFMIWQWGKKFRSVKSS
jgi:hypothetical protein